MSEADERLDRIEEIARQLAREVALLKVERRRTAAPPIAAAPSVAVPAPPKAPSLPPPAPWSPPAASSGATSGPRYAASWFENLFENGEFEKLVGRYGALALAVITTVMGVGALVSWALRAGYLIPWVRVGLGATLAVGIATGGWHLRSRGARAFGNTLLALALAVIQVVAWGAGPRLGLVPSWSAILVADVASAMLIWLALHEEHQSLFTVGFGGALLAPFVMSTGQGLRPMLASYGVVLLGWAMRALEGRPWRGALGMIALSVGVYTFALVGHDGAFAWLNRELPVMFAIAVTLLALTTAESPNRRWIGLTAVASMALVMSRNVPASIAPGAILDIASILARTDVFVAAYVGTILVFAVVREFEHESELAHWLLTVTLIPAVFLLAPLTVIQVGRGGHEMLASAIVLAWALLFGAVGFKATAWRRGVLLASTGILVTVAIPLLFHSIPWLAVPALALNATAWALIASRAKQPITLLAAGGSLLVALVNTAEQLAALEGYSGAPFWSSSSLAGAASVIATFVVLRTSIPTVDAAFGDHTRTRHMTILQTCILAFVWGRVELSHAISADASTFLLIMYHAAWGIAAIHVGRTVSHRIRQVGLALSVYAALWAVVGASNVQQIVLRVGTYLGVGGFLMGVAWFYRQRDTEPATAAPESAAANSSRVP